MPSGSQGTKKRRSFFKELVFVRYIIGHGPATVHDLAWWSGLPRTIAHQGSAAGDDRIAQMSVEGAVYYRAARTPRQSRDPELLALPSFDEYFLGYYGRTFACTLDDQKYVGPLQNGVVRPILVSAGEVVGTWRHSRSGTATGLPPISGLFSDDGRIPQERVDTALRRYHDFIA